MDTHAKKHEKTKREQELQYWKISGHLESLKAKGEKVRSFWSSASTSKFSSIIFCICIYNVIILIAHLILLLSYYSTLIALIRVKKKSIRKHKTLSKVIDERETCCLSIFNWHILIPHLISLFLYVIWLSYLKVTPISWYSALIVLIRLEINIKKYNTFLISQA